MIASQGFLAKSDRMSIYSTPAHLTTFLHRRPADFPNIGIVLRVSCKGCMGISTGDAAALAEPVAKAWFAAVDTVSSAGAQELDLALCPPYQLPPCCSHAQSHIPGLFTLMARCWRVTEFVHTHWSTPIHCAGPEW